MVPNWIRRRNNYPALPVRLRWYIRAVSIGGPVVAIALLAGSGHSPAEGHWPAALVLLLLASIAERFPIHLTHRTNLNVSTAVYVAMFLLLPPMTVGTFALVAVATAQAVRMHAHIELGFAETLFHVGQTTLYVSLTGILLAAATDAGLPKLAYVGLSLSALGLATLSLHLGNTLLVSLAAGLHLDVAPLRIWRRNLAMDLVPILGMSLLGICAAALGAESAYLIPALFVPAVLVHRAVGESVQLQENMRSSLASLVDIIELRDPYTAGHSRRVAATARSLALELGLTAEEADLIQSAGQVHDLGKVAVDPGILAKPGKLTEAEWLQMKRHPVFSAEVIGQFAAYQAGAPLVRGHHESWDGSGYPDGIGGEKIPLGARILAVADTFDALTSDRSYRNGMTPSQARLILAEGAGTQWDSAVVEAMFRLLDQNPDRVLIYRRVAEDEGSEGAAFTSVA
jgi:HD-GYP domain-containing protein (c-di-GMP phosphodiesterase class II)